jgi:hypothetical protein
MKPQVIQAVIDAFGTSEVEDHLEERGGRVYGSVAVSNSSVFDDLDDTRRQRLFWQHLIRLLGRRAADVGPVVLESAPHG